MSSSVQKRRDRLQSWIEKTLRPCCPELEAPLMAAVDAFDLARQTGELPPERLRPILAAVSSSRRPLYENTCELMGILSASWPEANDAILAMSLIGSDPERSGPDVGGGNLLVLLLPIIAIYGVAFFYLLLDRIPTHR